MIYVNSLFFKGIDLNYKIVTSSYERNNYYSSSKTDPVFDFLATRALWIWGITPPPAIVALIRESNSSSPLIASCKCLGVILLTPWSLHSLPANSNTSAVRYSKMAALYTAAVAPTRPVVTLLFKNL